MILLNIRPPKLLQSLPEFAFWPAAFIQVSAEWSIFPGPKASVDLQVQTSMCKAILVPPGQRKIQYRIVEYFRRTAEWVQQILTQADKNAAETMRDER
jgi:hypothetical protein